MDWNWAIEAMRAGERVRHREWYTEAFIRLVNTIDFNDDISLCRGTCIINEKGTSYLPCSSQMFSNDWELYEESKEWTNKDIDLAKAWYNLGFKYVFRCEFSLMMLSRETNSKEYEKGTAFQDIDYDYFPSLKVGECVALQDIIDSEVK